MERNRRKMNTPHNDDPYERGFAHKLYENDIGHMPYYDAPRSKQARAPKKKGKGLRVLLSLLLILVVIVAAALACAHFYAQQPMGSPNGHLDGVSTILIVV